MKVGLSMNSVFIELEKLADSTHRLDNIVFIFDTLKKIINVINKAHAKQLFSILRKLSAKGMTTILLAHTNKYTDDNGHPIYEGTGDMRSDVDELIYLLPQKHSDGTMTVTTHPDNPMNQLIFKPLKLFKRISMRIKKLLMQLNQLSIQEIQLRNR